MHAFSKLRLGCALGWLCAKLWGPLHALILLPLVGETQQRLEYVWLYAVFSNVSLVVGACSCAVKP